MRNWLFALLLGLLGGCASKGPTAQELVQNYADACRRGDAKALGDLRPGADFYKELAQQPDLLPAARKEFESFSKEAEVRFLQDEISHNSDSITHWKETRFSSLNSDDGRILSVLVQVGDGGSASLTLLRNEQGQLQLYPLADTGPLGTWAKAHPAKK